MMEIVQLNTIEDVYKAYNDVKNTFENLENEVNIDDYLHKIFQFGKVFGVYEKNADKYFGFSAVYMNDFSIQLWPVLSSSSLAISLPLML